MEQVCDGAEHCNDGTDELSSWCSQTSTFGSCGSDNASCEHFCHDQPGGHVICTCQYGYQLGSDGRSCYGEYCTASILTVHGRVSMQVM